MRGKILIVEDEKLVRWSLKEQLSEREFKVLEAENGSEAKILFEDSVPDLILLDIKLPDANGLDLLEGFHDSVPDIPVIMMTGHGTVETAIEAMRRGAVDYIDKPFNVNELEIKINKALEQSSLAREVRYLRRQSGQVSGFDHIIATSEVMLKLLETVKKICRSPATTVLLTGENGTGKDIMARAIHANSDRAGKPFMNITCSALPDQLLESELFGHEKGAFTDAKVQKKGLFEMAHGGTIFLDEISETSQAFQSKLLRFLEEKSFKRVGGNEDINVDVRVIASSNRNLTEEIEENRFREDLYYRLSIMPIHLPPLRERPKDIHALARYFISYFNSEFKKNVRGLTPMAAEALEKHRWLGNVRELRNTIERAMIFCEDDQIDTVHLMFDQRQGQRSKHQVSLPSSGLDFEQDVEKRYVKEALKMSNGNHTRAAQLLGMNRDQIRYRIKKFNLTASEIQSHDSKI